MGLLKISLGCTNIFPKNNSDDSQLMFCSTNKELMCQTSCRAHWSYISRCPTVRKKHPSWRNYSLIISGGIWYVYFNIESYRKAICLFKLVVSLKYLFVFYTSIFKFWFICFGIKDC